MDEFSQRAASARQAHATGQPLPSPCVQVCRLSEDTGWCEGCFRRLEEIGAWPAMDERQKWAVWQQLAQRRAQAGLLDNGPQRPEHP